MKADVVIRGGLVVSSGGEEQGDVVIEGGSIAAVTAPGAGGPARRVIDATGLAVLPGGVDPHVHFDEPGRKEWEGWASGSLAALAGGVTTVLDMPIDSDPPTTSPETVQAKAAAGRASALVDFGLWGGLVPQNAASADAVIRSGVVGLKAFMCDSEWDAFPPCEAGHLASGMRFAARADVPVAVHCEDPALFADQGRERSVASEVSAVALAGAVAARQGARLHVVHCSSADAVVEAKLWPGVTVETCPHYLLLNGSDAARIGADAHCCPPIRDEAHRLRLWEAVHAGMIDCIASDHSPCPPSLKDRPNPFAGISGVQTTLSVLLSSGALTLAAISRLRTSAARLFGLARKGALEPGYDADVALVDLHADWYVSPDTLRDRHHRSPLVGRTLRGVVVSTLVRGEVVYHEGRQSAPPGGRFLRPHMAGGRSVPDRQAR